MAVLQDADRAELHAEVMRGLVPVTGITKPELRAAVNAIDQWINDNAAAFNSAIPQPARSALTSAQKARLLALVALKRYDKGV